MPAQPPQGSKGGGPGGPLGGAHDRCDLREAQPTRHPQSDQLAVAAGEPGDGRGGASGVLTQLDQRLDRFGAIAIAPGEPGDQLPGPAGAPEVVDRSVAGDAEEPGPDSPQLGAVPIVGGEGGDERVGGDLLGEAGPAHLGETEAIHRIRVGLVHPLEGRGIVHGLRGRGVLGRERRAVETSRGDANHRPLQRARRQDVTPHQPGGKRDRARTRHPTAAQMPPR